MYISNRKDLRTLEGLIRNEANQKEITKAFKKFQKTFLECSLEYKKEKSSIVEVATQKQPRKKKHKTEVVKLGDRTEMKATHMGGAAILELFKDGKRL